MIRATLPPGYTAVMLDSNLVVSELGTDEFDNETGELTLGHNSISNFVSGGPITYNELPLAYFTAIDDHIATVNSVDENEINITVYPNPTQDVIYFDVTEEVLGKLNNVRITDVSGKLILEEKFTTEIIVSHLPDGIYFIKVDTGGDTNLFYRFVKE